MFPHLKPKVALTVQPARRRMKWKPGPWTNTQRPTKPSGH